MNVPEFFDLSGDTAVITGAGRGIGEGIARVIAGAGAGVVLAARRTEEIERVAEQIRKDGGCAIAVTTDVTDEDAVEALAKAACDEFGGLDIWVNNAGGSPISQPLTELSREEWDATLKLNLTAVWACSVVAARHMDKGGRILNISSKAAVDPVRGSGHYSAAKAGLIGLTKTVAKELGGKGVTANVVAPGFIKTEMTAALIPHLEQEMTKRIATRRLGETADVAAAVSYLASEGASYVTGQVLVVDGGLAL